MVEPCPVKHPRASALRLVDRWSDAIDPPDVSDAISYDHVRL